jgi:hypothetical protein
MIEAPVVVEFHYKLGGVGAADIWQVAADTWSVWKARH